jgi:hypothetical protein
VLVFSSCKEEKKISLAGEDPVTAPEFISFFEALKLPATLSDSVLLRKLNDSVRISYPVLKAVVPDSSIRKLIGKTAKPIFHALGKIQVPDGETYIIIRAQHGAKKNILVLAFDKKFQFIAALPVFGAEKKKNTYQTLVIDRKYLINILQQRKNTDGSLSEGKEVYVLNEAAKKFMLIMTEALEDKVEELINPIDTLPARHRFAADYGTGKLNLVSVRDGRKPDRITFFVHFEKKNGNCIGELKGEAFWKSPQRAEYRQAGDPCILQFQFSRSAVTLREVNCGSRRGTDCLFDGSFSRKKSVRVKKKQ